MLDRSRVARQGLRGGLPQGQDLPRPQLIDLGDQAIVATRIEVKTGVGGGNPGGEGNNVVIKGVIQSLPTGDTLVGTWVIKDRFVHVTSSTRLAAEHGAFAANVRVKVKGLQLADGTVVATKIQVRDN